MRIKVVSLFIGCWVAMAVAQAASGEPLRVAKANFSFGKPAPAAMPASLAEGPVTVNVAEEAVLKSAVQSGMIEFIQRNYPSHLRMTMRSLQSGEGRAHKELEASVEFLKEFAQGPVTIEGAFRKIRGTLRYVITGTIRGVVGHPKATLRFETYPGPLRPVTDVTLDEDSDGTVDEESTGFCRLDRLWHWIEERFPQQNRLAHSAAGAADAG